MRVWIVVDTAHRSNIFQIGFETKAAADHYIATQGNPAWKAEPMTVYSERECRELFPQ